MLRKMNIVVAVLVATLAGCQGQGRLDANEGTQKPPSSQAQKGGADTHSETAFRKAMALDDIKHVQYRGVDGQPLAFENFIAAVDAGRSFDKTVDTGKSLAVLTINKKDAEGSGAPGSAPANRLNFQVGEALPPMRRRDLSGHLNVLANGKEYTLLSFFFADCVPCIQEVPALNSLAGGNRNMRVVSVTFDNKKLAAKFATQRGLKTAIVPDAKDYIDTIGVRVYPTLVLVSPEGRVVGIRSSYIVSSNHGSALAGLEAWLDSLGLKA